MLSSVLNQDVFTKIGTDSDGVDGWFAQQSSDGKLLVTTITNQKREAGDLKSGALLSNIRLIIHSRVCEKSTQCYPFLRD